MSKKLKFETSHCGTFKSNAEEFGYKTIVITGPIVGQKDVHFGRLIQVRKKSGLMGSDTVLIRKADGVLHSYHNMGFFSVNNDYLPMYEEAMRESDSKNLDGQDHEYSICGRNPAIGFIVHGYDDINNTMPKDAERDQKLKKLI